MEIKRCAWFWEKEFWLIAAINEIAEQTESVDVLVLTVADINYMIDEIAGTATRRFLNAPGFRVRLKAPDEIVINED